MAANSSMPATSCTYWVAGNWNRHSIRRQTALMPSAQTSGNRPPRAPAAAKASIATHSRRSEAERRCLAIKKAASSSTPAATSACCMSAA